jgi:hypothetical protein
MVLRGNGAKSAHRRLQWKLGAWQEIAGHGAWESIEGGTAKHGIVTLDRFRELFPGKDIR